VNFVLHTKVKSPFAVAVQTADTKLTSPSHINACDSPQYFSGNSLHVQLVFIARLCANPHLPFPTVKTAEREQQIVKLDTSN